MSSLSTATFGGGCFWCIEAVFKELQGVQAVQPGYSGGRDLAPTYESVCSGRTGHAEVVQVLYDPAQVDFVNLLEIFFHTHDPTTLNCQGNDVGPQYRSVIFYHNDNQRQIAEQYIQQLGASGVFDAPIVTQVVPFDVFYAAEDYHHNYFERNPNQPYCQFVIRPKLQKFRKTFEKKIAGQQ